MEVNEVLLEKLPLGAVQPIVVYPCAVAFKLIVVPGQAFIGIPASTAKTSTGATQPKLVYDANPAGVKLTVPPLLAPGFPLISTNKDRS